jgi:hypothetical protein
MIKVISSSYDTKTLYDAEAWDVDGEGNLLLYRDGEIIAQLQNDTFKSVERMDARGDDWWRAAGDATKLWADLRRDRGSMSLGLEQGHPMWQALDEMAKLYSKVTRAAVERE